MTAEPATPGSAPHPHWGVKIFARLHVFLNRLTGGRFFNSFGGSEICFVTMTGARSGRVLTLPLMYVPYKEGVLLVASLAGAPSPYDEAPRPSRRARREARPVACLRPSLSGLRRLPQAHHPRHSHIRVRAGRLRTRHAHHRRAPFRDPAA